MIDQRTPGLASEPSVGIFWGMPDEGETVLVTDATPLRLAEHYGDHLTHPRGHYEVWEGLRRLGPAGLARRGLPATIAFREYEEFPRGRIVHDKRESLFIMYADRKLQTFETVARVIDAFGLTGQRIAVRSDTHYRS